MLADCLIEREVLAKIRSPFCVNLHYSYQDEACIYLVLTLCPGGDLTFLLKSRCKRSLPHTVLIFFYCLTSHNSPHPSCTQTRMRGARSAISSH